MIILLTVGLIKTTYYNMSILPVYRSRTTDVKVKLDLEGYATKDDLKNITHADTSSFALKSNLSSLKTEVDKLDIPKLSTLPTDVAKLSNKVVNDLAEKTDFTSLKEKVTDNKTEQDNLETSINNVKTKVDGIDLTKYVKKTDYDTKVGNLQLKIPDVSGLLSTTAFNSKVSELENKIKTAENKADISNLANKTELKNVENKIPDQNVFVKKTDYATEITAIKNGYVTNASLTIHLNDLKSQHIADEVKRHKKL